MPVWIRCPYREAPANAHYISTFERRLPATFQTNRQPVYASVCEEPPAGSRQPGPVSTKLRKLEVEDGRDNSAFLRHILASRGEAFVMPTDNGCHCAMQD